MIFIVHHKLREEIKIPKQKREVSLGEPGKTPLGEPEKDLLESALNQMDKFREEVARSVSCSFFSFFVDKKHFQS